MTHSCYHQTLARAQTLPAYPVAAGEVTELCEEAVMNHCGYGLVDLSAAGRGGGDEVDGSGEEDGSVYL